MKLKSLVLNQLIEDEYAILMSDGIDSKALLFGCLEKNIKVTVYSFTLEDRESKDYIGAKNLCEELGVDFIPILLPTSTDNLIEDLSYLIKTYELKGKTNVECSWVLYRAIKSIKEKHILTGHGCDGHFGLSKKAMIHFKHSVEKMNEFRQGLFTNENYAQKRFLNEHTKDIGKTITLPYMHESVIEYFKDKSWDELNKPIQKQDIVNMFPEDFGKIKVNKHVNFQLGDSGISDLFKELLNIEDLNLKGFKNPVGIYNEIYRKFHN